MTLDELSAEYDQTASQVRARMVALQKESVRTTNPVARQELRQRILALQPLYRDTRAISSLTANYYHKRSRRHATNLLSSSTRVSSQTVSAPCKNPTVDPTPTGDDAPIL